MGNELGHRLVQVMMDASCNDELDEAMYIVNIFYPIMKDRLSVLERWNGDDSGGLL